MSSVWGDDDSEGDLNGDTNGAEMRLSNWDVLVLLLDAVVDDMEVIG